MKTFINMLKDESGASAAEYVLLLAILGAGIIAGVTALGGSIAQAMTDAGTALEGTVPAVAN